MASQSEHRIPHTLRLAIFFLRLAIGLDFFYLGWSFLFNQSLIFALRPQSMGGLYNWLALRTPVASVPDTVFAWIFLIAGILIAIGLFTRLSAIVAAALLLTSLLPGINFAAWNPVQFVNDEIVVFFALVVLVLAHAGTYLGLDKFIHWSRRRQKE